MLNKRFTAWLVVTIFSLSLFSTSAFAVQPMCDEVGIASDLSSHKIIKLDGAEGTSGQSTITNTQIINLGDSIGIFSSPWNPYYRITTSSAVSALLNSDNINLSKEEAVTDSGYHIACFNSDGIDDKGSIADGGSKIVATKDDVTYEIPVVDSVLLANYDETDIGKDWKNAPSGTSIKRDVPGLGGKASDDCALVFTVNPEKTLSSGNPLRADNRDIASLNSPKTVITLQFSIRITGDVVASLQRNGGYDLFKLTSDGMMKYYCYDKQKNVEVKVCDDMSYWHNVAITYDYAGNRLIYYFDGEQLPYTGDLASSTLSELRFGVASSTYQTGGTVAFDNLKINRGYFKPFERISVTPVDLDVAVESDSIVVNPENVLTLEDVMSKIETNATNYRFYSDGTFSTECDSLEFGSILVLCDEVNDIYSYYKIERLKLEVVDFKIIKEGTQAYAVASMKYPLSKGESATLVMGLIDSDGRICSLVSSPETKIVGTQDIVTPAVEVGECTPCAFIISNWSQRSSIHKTIIYEEE